MTWYLLNYVHNNNIYENILFVPWALCPTLIDSEIALKVFTLNRKSLGRIPYHGRKQRLPMWHFNTFRDRKAVSFDVKTFCHTNASIMVWHCCHRKQYMLITVDFTLNDLPINNIIENILTDFHDCFRLGWTWYKEQLGTFFRYYRSLSAYRNCFFLYIGGGGWWEWGGMNVCQYEMIVLILKIHQALYKNPLTKYHG